MAELEKLITISRQFGADIELVQGGGGNTSVKPGAGTLLVKASGTTLRDASADSFVMVDPVKVLQVLEADDLQALDLQQRDRHVAERINATVLDQSGRRPSIETFLHAMLPDKYIVHVHPVLVNALTCMVGGEQIAETLFIGVPFLWINYGAPGYPLAMTLKNGINKCRTAGRELPPLIFLENHGVIFSGESPDQICTLSEKTGMILKTYFGDCLLNSPFLHSHATPLDTDLLQIAFAASGGADRRIVAVSGAELAASVNDQEWKKMMTAAPLYPDHVVYCGEAPLLLHGIDDHEVVLSELNLFVQRFGYLPKVIVDDSSRTVFLVGQSSTEIETISMMLETHIKILAHIGLKGSLKHLSAEDGAYIANWESEKFRRALMIAGKDSNS